jgi:predicted nucleotidyltransferase/predicted transcriptional regulator
MRIARGEKINGIPLVKIRDYFNNIWRIGISKKYLGYHFCLSARNTNSLIKELIKNNYIEKAVFDKNKIFFDKDSEYQLTEKGHRLCSARASPPINRVKADKILSEFMQRVIEVNTNDYYLCKVEKIILFGSYLNPENIDFGDIDIAFELKRKIDDYNEFDKVRRKLIQEMKQKGRYFSTFDAELNFPKREVLLKLKNRCQYISLHEIEAEKEILKKTKCKQIFQSS